MLEALIVMIIGVLSGLYLAMRRQSDHEKIKSIEKEEKIERVKNELTNESIDDLIDSHNAEITRRNSDSENK